MASRVNVKFVVILAAVLGLVFAGVSVTALWVLTRSAAELEAKGDEAMQAGNYEQAVELYGKAFHRDQTDVDRLEKYIQAVRSSNPPQRTPYTDAYYRRLLPALQERATLKRTDVQAHAKVLETNLEQYRRGASRQAWEHLRELTDSALRYFQTAQDPDPQWERLRRYRGIALLNIAESGVQLHEDQRGTRREPGLLEQDLAAALRLDPADLTAADALARWYLHRALRAVDQRQPREVAVEWFDRAVGVIEDFLDNNPGDPAAGVLLVRVKYQRALGLIDRLMPLEAIATEQRRLREQFSPELTEAITALENTDAGALSFEFLNRLTGLERQIVGTYDASAAVLSRALEAHPTDPDLLYLRARLASLRGEHQASLGYYQRLVDLPRPPVSLEGVLLLESQVDAVRRQSEAALALWSAAQTQEQRAEALASALRYRDRLGELVPESSPALLLLSARIARAQGDLRAALRDLVRYDEIVDPPDPEAVFMLGQVLAQLGEMGRARQQYDRLAAMLPDNPQVMTQLARVEMDLRNTPRARELLAAALSVDPTNEEARQLLALAAAIDDPSAAEDPVQGALLFAQRVATGQHGGPPDPARALAAIEETIGAHGEREQLLMARVQLLYATGDTAAALAAAEHASAAYPQNTQFQNLADALSAGDSKEATYAQIDRMPLTEGQKLMLKYRTAMQHNEPEEAEAFLRSAADAEPNNPEVLDARFSLALSRGDLPAADTLAARAEELDADNVGGLTYRARLQHARGDAAQAATTLEQAAMRGTAGAEVWRLLGAVQLELGRGPDAARSFAQARRARPNDVRIILAHMTALMRLGRNTEALGVARESIRYARHDEQFTENWLRLEAAIGDRGRAVAERRARLASHPDDNTNKQSLAALYVEMGPPNLENARKLLDELRREQDSTALATLDARRHLAGNDPDGADRVFESFIASAPPGAEALAAHIAFGRLLIEQGRLDHAMQVLADAREHQNPETMDVDRFLASVLYERGQYERALDPLKRVAGNAAADPDQRFRAMLAESLIMLGRYDDAQQTIDAAGAQRIRDSVALSLLQADIAVARQDMREAETLLNQTIQRFPDEPVPYLKRANHLRSLPGRAPDAIADLDTAIRLSPGFWAALHLRAMIRMEQGDTEQALADLREAVRANPRLESERQAVIAQLIQTGRAREARAVANEALEARPDDHALAMGLGDTFSTLGFWDDAARYYARAWEASPSPQTARRHAVAQMRKNPPDLAAAERILANPAANTAGEPHLLMTRGALHQRRGRTEQARNDARSAVQLAGDDPQAVSAILDRVHEVIPDQAQAVRFIAELPFRQLPDHWGTYFRAQARVMLPGGAEEAISSLREVVASSEDPRLALMARRALSTALLHPERAMFEEALQVMKDGLQSHPEDWLFLNNAAFVLAKELDRPEEALQYAQKAAQAVPGSPVVLDTLGYVYRRLERLEEAEHSMRRAVEAANTVPLHLVTRLHLAQLLAQTQRNEEARGLLEQIDQITTQFPGVAESHKDELSELRNRLERGN